MNPHQAKKVDIKSLSPEEQRLFRLYGKLPSRSDHFAKHLKERKYFDSGDYAMSKAGKGDSVDTGSVGSQHPVPENIPHLSSPAGNSGSGGAPSLMLPHLHHHQGGALPAGSPVKESSFLGREMVAGEDEGKEEETREGEGAPATGPAAAAVAGGQSGEALPLRR